MSENVGGQDNTRNLAFGDLARERPGVPIFLQGKITQQEWDIAVLEKQQITEQIIKSVMTDGILSPEAIRKNKGSPLTANRSSYGNMPHEDNGISGALIFSDKHPHIKVVTKYPGHPEIVSLTVIVDTGGSSVNVAGFSDFSLEPRQSRNFTMSSSPLPLIDKSVDQSLYGGMSSVLPCMVERSTERARGFTSFIKDEVISRRASSSFLVTMELDAIKPGGSMILDQTELRIKQDRINPEKFQQVILPADLHRGNVQGLGVEEVKVNQRKAVLNNQGFPEEVEVPDYESQVRRIASQSASPIFIHGVRVPDETDLIIQKRPELLIEYLDWKKIIAAYRMDYRNLSDDDIQLLFRLLDKLFTIDAIKSSLSGIK